MGREGLRTSQSRFLPVRDSANRARGPATNPCPLPLSWDACWLPGESSQVITASRSCPGPSSHTYLLMAGPGAEQDESQSLLPSRWASQNQYGPNPEEGSRNDQENLERSKVGLTDGARSISGSFSGTIKFVRVLKQVK